MLHVLKRHPIPISAWFRHCLVLTYAYPTQVLKPLLPPGLTLDEWNGVGFVAIAMVQTENLRPTALPPALGCSFFLTGYRIFARYKTAEGRTLRGLRILRSDTDSQRMVWSGNLLTHYHYKKCKATIRFEDGKLGVLIRSKDGLADLDVEADTKCEIASPEGGVFATWSEARRFAGPLPFTFDYEKETNSIVRIKGVRDDWNPRPVRVVVREATMLRSPMFAGSSAKFASAFYTGGIDYRWERGILEPLRVATA